MRIVWVLVSLLLSFCLIVPGLVLAEPEQKGASAPEDVPVQLNQFTYSYGTVLKVSPVEIILQEYDYDSDVEKEVGYQLDSSVKLEGFKGIDNLVVQDVVEIYYLEQDGKKIAKIIRREIMDEENSSAENRSE